MQPHQLSLSDEYTLHVYEQVAAVGKLVWDSIHPQAPFYQRFDFLQLIEQLPSDMQFRYVLLYRKEELLGAVYVQSLVFHYHNLVQYHTESGGLFKNMMKRFFDGKTTALLNVGNVFFTGDTGIIAQDQDAVLEFLPDILHRVRDTFARAKPAAFLIASVSQQDRQRCRRYCQRSFHDFVTEPDMYMSVRPEWQQMDDYMQSLSSKYKVRSRKIFKVSEALVVKNLSIQDIETEEPRLEQLYTNVVNHVAFNMATLHVSFFKKVKALYGDKCMLYGYYLHGELVSFACLFQVEPGYLHVHYIGLNYEYNKSLKLYNRMLLDFVEVAIQRRVHTIHFGRTATEIKTTIGATPKPLQAFLQMNNRLLNASLPYFLKRIKPQEYIVRHPFKETAND